MPNSILQARSDGAGERTTEDISAVAAKNTTTSAPETTSASQTAAEVNPAVGSYVAVGYYDKWYPGAVEHFSEDNNEIVVNFMEVKGINTFSGPKNEDRLSAKLTEVLSTVPAPSHNKRLNQAKADFAKANAAFANWL